MIEVKNLEKSFDGKSVLKGISTVFEPGKMNLIIGRSGSGKTVLMKSVIGLHKVDCGEILFHSRDLVKMNEKEIKNLHKEVGMLFQGSALFDSMTVFQNVMFPLEMFSSLTKNEMEKRAEFCINRVNLSHAKNRFPSEISGGMQKRAAIARAIALNPKYLFCDEPNSGLDPQTSLVIDHLIKEITQEYDITTIINTHDMNSVMEMGDNIVFIHEGKKAWQGSNRELFNNENKELNEFVFASELFKAVREAKNIKFLK